MTSQVGRMCASSRWPPCAVPSLLPITACACTAGLPSFRATSPMSDRSSTCSSSVTDGSYFLLSQLNQSKRSDESAPTALKLAADRFSCSANSSSPFASSSPVSKTRMNFRRLIDLPGLHRSSSIRLVLEIIHMMRYSVARVAEGCCPSTKRASSFLSLSGCGGRNPKRYGARLSRQ